MKYFLLLYACFSAGTALADNFDKDWAKLDKDFERLNQRYATPRAKPDLAPPSQGEIASPKSELGEETAAESTNQSESESNSEKSAIQGKRAL